jgi:SpoVK/Ycf46/Vps4 family AAA+-type ATPase
MIHAFLDQLASIINLGQARSVVLSGNIYDLFYDGTKFVPLIDFLVAKCKADATQSSKGLLIVTYRLNHDVVIGENGKKELADVFKTVTGEDLDECCQQANGHPTMAMEFLRQLTVCSRQSKLKYNLFVIVEAADMLLPEEDIARLNLADRHRIQTMCNWFCDPDFMNGYDSVCLIAESPSQIHGRISRLPQILNVEIPLPNLEERQLFISKRTAPAGTPANLDQLTAGLSLHALRQLLCQKKVAFEDVSKKVESFMISQLGDAIEFKRPSHTFKDVIGYANIKKFLQDEVIPRFQAIDRSVALSGLLFCGPLGGGKTFLGEALAAEIQLPVLVLKNLRSKWFGETDVIFERLSRCIASFNKLVIFLDEADTAFGNLSSEDTHETEKRLTGKIQAMMSDPDLKGVILWLLMTARPHKLSPDIRRSGRAGDLIIPVLDPEGEDRKAFIEWVLGTISQGSVCEGSDAIDKATQGYSSAAFSSLRSLAKSKGCQTVSDLIKVADDLISADIGDTRRYQILQALMNCTRKSLLPQFTGKLEQQREKWRNEIIDLERKGQK